MPLSFVRAIADCVDVIAGLVLVPACGECNAIASDRVFKTIAVKRRFIHDRLRRKHASVLGMPEWSEAEISELGYGLQTVVRAGLAQKRVLQQRLAWRNTSMSSPVDIAAIRLSVLGGGRRSVRRHAGRHGITGGAPGI